jgi:hypothetical protein
MKRMKFESVRVKELRTPLAACVQRAVEEVEGTRKGEAQADVDRKLWKLEQELFDPFNRV